MKKETVYYQIKGEQGVYILTQKEMDRALDRENDGVVGILKTEQEYTC